ncbi:6-carboxytetrahydropterin synthase [Microbulbifer sp. OS29]|uniref:6-carboxy-5,6,7,8-tetrahydropterin synthase n=1 Tax=Microbulbifer okhotskensis TaxID=2926617 RepID=A0A9X2ELI1_9GAMM|nr:6-carboxytetrahydropterin synthase [Microbulbifer okhotskensis]MCO1334442.1 6-carboxytetrahydropterin synthase [Microbulbifer okhotskensis]
MHLFVDNLTNVDFSYLDHSRGLVGETWLADAALDGALDEQGMVCDFGVVKKTLRHWLDDQLDHRLLVPTLSPHLSINHSEGHVNLDWLLGSGESISVSGPEQAFALVETEEIKTDSVAIWSVQQLANSFPASVEQLKLSFHSECIEDAFYHYSHGLKKHLGNCQRIAHGHRSRIQVFINGRRSAEKEKDWAKRWEDIYVGTREDLSSTRPGKHGEEILNFAYQAQQGDFTLSIPAALCEIIDCDTTVEQLAQYIANTLGTEEPGQEITVRAYEGIGKGAIASAKY